MRNQHSLLFSWLFFSLSTKSRRIHIHRTLYDLTTDFLLMINMSIHFKYRYPVNVILKSLAFDQQRSTTTKQWNFLRRTTICLAMQCIPTITEAGDSVIKGKSMMRKRRRKTHMMKWTHTTRSYWKKVCNKSWCLVNKESMSRYPSTRLE